MEIFEKDFKEWFYKAVPTVSYDIFMHQTTHFSMQWGVYVDFFMAKDLMIETLFYWGGNWWKVEISRRKKEDKNGQFYTVLMWGREDFTSLDDARKAAFEKAIEIYNTNSRD